MTMNWKYTRVTIKPQNSKMTRHCISTRAALHLLGFPQEQDAHSLSISQLRQAYFVAAKRCHPDVHQKNNDENNKKGHDDFLRLTAAYEVLSQAVVGDNSDIATGTIISAEEEEAFRMACDLQLGVPAEIVEECKRSPIFRRWLAGRTDAAHTWRNFLTQNGGLTPQLPVVAGQLTMDWNDAYDGTTPQRLRSRRKRP